MGRARAPIALLVLLLGALVAGCALTSDGTAGSKRPAFRVMAFNIHHAADADGVLDVERTARVIRDSGADVVALQEVDRGVERSERRDLVAELSDLTGLPHTAFGHNLDFQGGAYGNALLSRYPINDAENILLEQVVPHEQRGVLRARVDVDGRSVTVFVVHLDHQHASERLRGLDQIEELLPPPDEAVVLAGDLNAEPESPAYARATAFLNDAWVAAGMGDGFTFPADVPARRIDYVFYRPPLEPVSAEVLQTQASDHRPVVVGFAWRD